MYSVYSVGPPTGPEVEKIMFIDRYMPIDVPKFPDPTGVGGNCDNTSTNFKKTKGGIHWQEFPVKYNIDTALFNGDKTAARDAVKRAFDTWDAENHGGTATTPPVFFEEVDNAADAKITVEWATIDEVSGGILGSALTSLNPKEKRINSVEIVLDKDEDWRNFPFTIVCGPQGAEEGLQFDTEDVAVHEIGHAVGLAHVNGGEDRFNTEYVSIIFEGETHKRTLGDGDKEAMFSLYGDGGDGNGGNGGGGKKCPPGNKEHPKCPTPP